MPFRSSTGGQLALRGQRPRRAVAALIAGLALAALADLALATPQPLLRTANNAAIGKIIVVDSRGVTLYELRPETIHHLRCTKTKGCFRAWPPVMVASARTKLTAASGVRGKLGILHRNGMFQVTLGGHPLYRFAGDASTVGFATGQGVHSFGGTWHVVVEQGTSMNTTTTTTTTPPYGY